MEDNLILTANPCCDTIPTCDCDMHVPGTPAPIISATCSCECSDKENEYMYFAKLAAALQESVLHSWKLHLKAKKYSIHVILEEYYNDALDMIDAFIEHYQGICGCTIIDGSVSDVLVSDDPFTYFNSLKDYVLNFSNDSNIFNEKNSEIKSDIDDILRLIDSTLYKLSHLTESKIKSFDAFVYEDFK